MTGRPIYQAFSPAMLYMLGAIGLAAWGPVAQGIEQQPSKRAEDLRTILAIVEAETKAMAEAQQRFAAKKPTQKHPAKSAERGGLAN